MAESETMFVRKRRRAAAEDAQNSTSAGSSVNATDLMRSALDHDHLSQWDTGHDDEIKFQAKKLRAREIQAVAEGTLEGNDELHHEVRKVAAARIKKQRARERKHSRDVAAMAGMTRDEARQSLRGKSVHIASTVPTSHKPGIAAACRAMEMTLVDKHIADVFVVQVPGSAPKSIMVTSAIRGSYQVSVAAMMSHMCQGNVLKWNDIAHIPRKIFVSSACYELQKAGIDYIKSVLASTSDNKIDIEIGEWGKLVALNATYVKTPARVIAVVNGSELTNPVRY